MPKRAESNNTVDPVRSRLAASVAAPATETEAKPQKAPPKSKPSTPPESTPSCGASDRLTTSRKFMLTDAEAERIDETTRIVCRAFGCKVSHSAISRVLWTILADASEQIRRRPRQGEKISPPPKGDKLATAELEEALHDYLLQSLKR